MSAYAAARSTKGMGGATCGFARAHTPDVCRATITTNKRRRERLANPSSVTEPGNPASRRRCRAHCLRPPSRQPFRSWRTWSFSASCRRDVSESKWSGQGVAGQGGDEGAKGERKGKNRGGGRREVRPRIRTFALAILVQTCECAGVRRIAASSTSARPVRMRYRFAGKALRLVGQRRERR
ncbi:hypothetical protein B0H13DRAFT_2012559 [Mycena leptocephala]|nr:hypothetical protein B0H13DRAFT_2012559 [Mycena leptocephala]